MSCSIGVGISPDDSANADDLIRKADMAMYQAKKSGKNTYHFFDEKLDKIAPFLAASVSFFDFA